MPFINGTDFIDFMIKHKDSSYIINNIISSYNHLLVSLSKLQQNNILHYDLKGTNIMFDNDTKLPLLIDFGLSAIIENDISDEQMSEIFYVFGADYYVWPLEVHYISYLINENKDPSQEELVNIVEEFVDNNKGITKKIFQNLLLKNIKTNVWFNYKNITH